jgi:hypothetical protein
VWPSSEILFLAAELMGFRLDEDRIVGKNFLHLFRLYSVPSDMRDILLVPIESANLSAIHLLTLYV